MERAGYEHFGVNAYMFEPEFSDAELALMDSEPTATHATVQADGEVLSLENPARLYDISLWCKCTKCTLMETTLESLCCVENNTCRMHMEDYDDDTCITMHPGFRETCLVRSVLELLTTAMHEWRGNVGPSQRSNRWYRLISYRAYTFWVHGRLGKDVRRVIPSCVVNAIRTTFPSEDGDYAGFRYAEVLAGLDL